MGCPRRLEYEFIIAVHKLFQKHFNFTGSVTELERLGIARTKQLNVIEQNCEIFKQHVIAKPMLEVGFLTCQATSHLMHRIHLLYDLGFSQFTAGDLWKIGTCQRLPITQVLQSFDATLTGDVIENALKAVNVDRSKVDFFKHLNPNLRFIDFYRVCLNYHLINNLHLSPIAINRIIKREKSCSFSLMNTVYRYYKNSKIFNLQTNPELLTALPENVELILSFIDNLKFGDLVGTQILRAIPHLVFLPASNIREGVETLLEHGVSLAGFRTQYTILLTNRETLIKRLDILKEDAELWMHRKHPRFVQLLRFTPETVAHWTRAARNFSNATNISIFDILKNYKKPVRRSSRNIVHFDGSLNCTVPIPRRSNALEYILETELGSCAKVASKIIVAHPQYKHVKFLSICETARMLKQRYSAEDIMHNAQILLYDKHIISDCLKEFYTQYQGVQHTYTDSQTLSMCHYLIERATNFSGDGIFRDEFFSSELDEETNQTAMMY